VNDATPQAGKPGSIIALAAEVTQLDTLAAAADWSTSTELRWRSLCRRAAPRLAAFVAEVDRLTAEMMDAADRDGEPEAQCAIGEVRRRLGLDVEP
jgi:hypothetical protein